ncbi:lysylphosphatidylglycerol synthase transmembrane domain-containing protein [Limoniibacter endophyticus]|uniref:Lysylphosphatidylglycerol synthase-like protein n=1 Tax=Limoniibacter endophyticus TaxID=1565040 RepID=A0A8J3GFV3_9HYPH|nr:lysylphosphatidylglycerol synthase transmembrane domain-containing protein [Limoniibacter endophyticus]GHC69139.1 hypothetical protein GCM10010136_14580 [Limoniibacter endophyticus]
MKLKRYKWLAAPLFALFCLVGVFAFVDWREIARSLAAASPFYLLAGLVLVQVQIVLSALRWRYTAHQLGRSLPAGRAILEYYASSFANMVMPGGVAGDAVRVARSRQEGEGWAGAVQAVMIERFSGQLAFFIVTTAGFFIWPFLDAGDRPPETAHILAVIILICVAVTVSLFGFRRFGPRSVRARIADFTNAAARAYSLPIAAVTQTMLSGTIVASYIASFAAVSAAIGAPLPGAAILTAVPLCLLTMMVPLATGGWGAREAAAAALWPVFGFTADQGVAASILYGAIATLGAAPGLLAYMRKYQAFTG